MNEWEEMRRQVGIAGSVTHEQTGNGVAGVLVTITSMPERFRAVVEAGIRGTVSKRLDQTITARDGSFFFVELPGGDYELNAVAKGAEHGGSGRGRGEVTIDSQGNITMTNIDIVLRPEENAKRSRSRT